MNMIVNRGLPVLVHRLGSKREKSGPEVSPPGGQAEDVGGRKKEAASGPEHPPALADEGKLVFQVLDALEARQHVEAAVAVWKPFREIGEFDRDLRHPELLGKEITGLHVKPELPNAASKRAATRRHIQHPALSGPGGKDFPGSIVSLMTGVDRKSLGLSGRSGRRNAHGHTTL